MSAWVLSTSSRFARRAEPGVETLLFLRICALRIRESRSPIGSFMDMRPSSPARLHEAGDQALGAKLAHRNAAHLELAVIGARTAGDLAATAHADFCGVARQFRELQRRREALFHRHGLVHRNLLQPRAASGILLGR